MKVTVDVQINVDITALASRVARQTLSRLMSEVALPEAVEKAPGSSLPSRIEVAPIQEVGNGKYRIALRFPHKYASVEYGSGIYAGGESQLIKPKKRKALALPYGYFKSAMWVGQEAQPFATPAVEHVAEMFPTEFANDFNRALPRSNRRPTKG